MSSRLYIGRLSSRASERDVEHFFRGYGKITDVVLKDGFGFIEFDDNRDAEDAMYDLNGKDLLGERVILEPTKRPGFRGYEGGGRGGGGGSRGGYGSSSRDRGDYGRGGSDRGGGRGGQPAWLTKYGAPEHTKYRLVVENLSTKYSWQNWWLKTCQKTVLHDLKDVFREYGVDGMGYADAHRVKKNEAIICFLNQSDLRRAIDKMDGKDLNGRKIKCIDDSRDAGSRSRSNSRSRSRSPRSRSRSRSRGSRSRSRSYNSRSRSPSDRGSPR